MAKYCDTQILEENWFHWLLARATPSLKRFRVHNLLWTRIVGWAVNKKDCIILKNNRLYRNPTYPIRMHCIALARPLFFTSIDGIIPTYGITTNDQLFKISDIQLSLTSTHPLHKLHNGRLSQFRSVIPQLIANGYCRERPEEQSWHKLLEDINKICSGIAAKFRQPNEEEHNDLTSEAFLQVCRKLSEDRLVYIPGMAPVFNLLTTTIYRCMYSIMNRRRNHRVRTNEYVEEKGRECL